MKLLLTKRNAPGSLLIRAVTWSDFSHCDVVMRDGNLIGACAPSGVCVTGFDERVVHSSSAILIDAPVVDLSAAYAFAIQQIGTPYDWLGVAGVGIHRDWQDTDKWFCSEFSAAVMKAGGYEPYRSELMRRITPQDLYALNLPMEVLK